MFKFTFNSIKTRVRLFFIVNIGLVIFNYFYVNYYDQKSQLDQAKVEVSRENEKTIEKISLTTQLVYGGEAELKRKLSIYTKAYQTNLDALKSGGDAAIGGESVTLQSSEIGQREIKSLEFAWAELNANIKIIIDKKLKIDSLVSTSKADSIARAKDRIEKELKEKKEQKEDPKKDPKKDKEKDKELKEKDKKERELKDADEANESLQLYQETNPEIQKAYFSAQSALDEVLTKNKELTSVFKTNYEETNQFLASVIFITFMLNLLVLLVGTFVIGTYFITPLKKISESAEKVANGDVNINTDYRRKDEIGEVSGSLSLIVNSFKQYADFAQNIGQGKFDTPFTLKSEQDALGTALQAMRENLRRIDDEDNKRNWSNEGFTLFAGILRNNEQNFEEFSYQIISNLVKYLEANQGGIFLLIKENEEEYLELKASFAYNKRKYEEKKVAVGQGLLGQAILERDIIYLKDVPQEYLHITSGLGKATPKCLLIAPLQTNDEVFGAVEIASFQDMEEHQIKFIERLSENIASSIASVRNNENNKKLLDEAKFSQEQMFAQEEQRRQNMEELAATQEIMEKDRRQLQEYKENLEREVESRTAMIRDQEKVLENTLSQLQGIIDSSRAGIVALNRNFEVVAANRQVRELVRTIRNAEFSLGDYWLNTFQDEEKRNRAKVLWERAFSGVHFSQEDSYVVENQVRRWYEFSYSPIFNENKEIMGASMFVRDITDRKRELKHIELNAHILDNSSNEVYVFDANTFKYTIVNEKARQNLGYTIEELHKLTPYEIEPLYTRESFAERIKPLQKGEMNFLILETTHYRKDGSSYNVELNLQYFEDEETPLFAAIAQDITQRKQNEKQLNDAISRFDLATQATKDGLWEMNVMPNDPVNPDNPVWFSPRFSELLGFDEDDFLGKLDSWASRLHPEDREKVLRNLYNHITDKTGETPFEVEFRIANRLQEFLWFSATAETQRDIDGVPVKIAGSIRNINRRKKAEEELLEQNAVVSAIFNASNNSIISVDTEGKILSANPATYNMFGYHYPDLVGKSLYKLLTNKQLEVQHLVDTTTQAHGVKSDNTTFEMEMSVSESNVNTRKVYAIIIRYVKS